MLNIDVQIETDKHKELPQCGFARWFCKMVLQGGSVTLFCNVVL